MSTTTFDQSSVTYYEFANGRKPKGVGLWMFLLHRGGTATQTEHHGSFTEAKKAALREARTLGCDTVTVCS
jgi:hypothetical protein